MRAALPDHIAGLPVTQIESFDISDTANKVYALNFHGQDKGSDKEKGSETKGEEKGSKTKDDLPSSSSSSGGGSRVGGDNIRGDNIRGNNIRGGMHPLLIERLKLADVDGRADVWTMSPPCQVIVQLTNYII